MVQYFSKRQRSAEADVCSAVRGKLEVSTLAATCSQFGSTL